MSLLVFSSIQSAAYGNLFECSTAEAKISDALFSSMAHANQVGVWDDGEALFVVSLLNTEGLKLKFPKYAASDGLVIRHRKNDLTDHMVLLGEIFRAAATLPPDPSAVLPERTEHQSVVRTRLGQHKYRICGDRPRPSFRFSGVRLLSYCVHSNRSMSLSTSGSRNGKDACCGS